MFPHHGGLRLDVSHLLQLALCEGNSHLHMYPSLIQVIRLFRQHLSRSVEIHGDDVEPQLLCDIESPLVKAADTAVYGTRALRIQRYAVATLHQRTETRHQLVNAHRNRIALGITNEQSVQAAVPHPVIGQEYHVWCADKLACKVKMRLMVADDDRRLAEIHLLAHLPAE